jgi:myo-inositol-1(or 4)-monophosphatase
MRNIGSAALSLAYTASGRIDIACHDRLHAWDMLAGALLIEESGGVATDFQGCRLTMASRDIIAAGSDEMHAAVLRVAQSVTGKPNATEH